MGTELQLRKVKNLGDGYGESCTGMRMYFVPLNYIVNTVKIVCFILCDFYHIKSVIIPLYAQFLSILAVKTV